MMNLYRETADFNEKQAISNIEKNSKYFFSYIKKFSKVKSNVGPLKNENDELTADPMEMAELLSKQYSSVFSIPTDVPQETPVSNDHTPCIDNIIFNENDIINAIDELRPNSSSGPDGFSAALLKHCKESLSKPLHIFWKKSHQNGQVPKILKSAHITPIYKSKCKSLPVNYHPVASTPHLMKIFEKIVRNNLVTYLDQNNLFNPIQHGFRKGRSCLSQLLSHYDKILPLIENGLNVVDVVYLDFAKAFDKVDIKKSFIRQYVLMLKENFTIGLSHFY